MTHLALTPVFYLPGTGGVPSSTPLFPPFLDNLTSYEHTIGAQFGFESCTLQAPSTLEDALDAANTLLMSSVVVYGPDAQIIWEGFCNAVDVTMGQEQLSRSLDPLANRVRVRYTTTNGNPGVSTTYSDATSQARYGIKDAVISANAWNKTAANILAQKELNRRRWPLSTPSSNVGSGDLGAVALTVRCTGWYEALGWLIATNNNTSTAVTTTQVQDLITAYNTTNDFFSTTFTNVVASGISETQKIETDTTYRQKIDQLLGLGNSSNQRLAWGFYEGRTLHVKEWAGAAPGTATYRRYLGDAHVYTTGNTIVEPWDVRPDAMYEVPEQLDVAPLSTASDTAARYYVERVSCRIGEGGQSVSLEPQASDALDAILSRALFRG